MESAVKSDDAVRRLYDGNSFKANNPDQNRLVLKNGSYFLVLDESGFIPQDPTHSPFGLYRDDTRYLCAWQMFVNGASLRLLSSNLSSGFESDFVYGNQAGTGLAEQSLMVRRQLVIDRHVHERVTIRNYNPKSVSFEFAIAYGADFFDIFEVRGTQRTGRGSVQAPKTTSLGGKLKGKRIKLAYQGLDDTAMTQVIDVRSKLTINKSVDGLVRVDISLKPGQEVELEITNQAYLGTDKSKSLRYSSFSDAQKRARSSFESWKESAASIHTENEEMNRLLEQAYKDLFILRQPLPDGEALAAGLPWFACAFGRDQAIAGMQVLPFIPGLAKAIVSNLASYQGTKVDSYTEEKPGKIMHELRLGEMARLKETPFSPYYGTVDATPLWLMLLTRYVEWSGDLDFAKTLWPNIKAAVKYFESELAQFGYLSYGGENKTALVNQGWKDSPDSIMYENGDLVDGAVCLVEAQGYLYAALQGLKTLSEKLKKKDTAQNVEQIAASLRARFQKDFWIKEKDFPALALDSNGKQCAVISSNPGHLIGTGILTSRQEAQVSMRLLEDDMFCQWGIRTLSSQEHGYNPMSYHNGSIWPHDNAMIVDGMAHSEHKESIHRILLALIKLAGYQSDGRLPELVCGFASNEDEGPISYPISCTPQAWSAGAPLQILASCFGISYDANSKTVYVSNPSLPDWLGTVRVTNLRFGSGRLDLEFTTCDGETIATCLSKSNGLDLVID